MTNLTRTGNIITLDDFSRELLGAMLSEDVPTTLTVDQATALVKRVRQISGQGMQYGAMLNSFLTEIDEVLMDFK